MNLLFLLMNVAHAASPGGAHGDPHAIPWTTIFVQGINLVLLLAILTFALRKTVKALFANRATEYKDLVQRADAAKAEAESKHQQMQERMAKLDRSANEGVDQAKIEAAELKNRLIAEAKALSEKLAEEAKRTTAVEIEKGKAELRRELLTEALGAAKSGLQSGLGQSDQKALQNEFVEKIQVVGN